MTESNSPSALTRWSLANNLRDQKRWDEAETVYEETLTILTRIGGSGRHENAQLPEFVGDYLKMLVAANRPEKTKQLKARLEGDKD